MLEAIAWRLLHQQLSGHQLVQAIRCFHFAASCRQAHQVEAESRAQDGADLQHLPRLRAEALQARLHCLPDSVGQREVFQVGQRPRKPTCLDKGTQRLQQEEGVAARRLLKPVG